MVCPGNELLHRECEHPEVSPASEDTQHWLHHPLWLRQSQVLSMFKRRVKRVLLLMGSARFWRGRWDQKYLYVIFFFNTICFLFSILYTNYIQQVVNSGLFSIWRWIWASPGSCWWTGRPGVLQSMGSQRVRHDWVTELILFMGIMIQFHSLYFLLHTSSTFSEIMNKYYLC